MASFSDLNKSPIMNISSLFFLASLLDKIVAAGGGVITDWEIEKGNIARALFLALSVAIAIPLGKKLWRYITRCPNPFHAGWLKNVCVVGFCCFLVLCSVYIVWGKGVTVDVTNVTGASRRSVIAVITDNGHDKLGTAEIFRTDDQGVLQTWKFPGRHRYLLIKPEGGVLFSSMAVRNKSLFPLKVSFSPPFHSVPLVEAVLDRFIFDRDLLPGSGTSLYDKLHDAVKDPEQWYLVIGHTDTEGKEGYNKALGQRRAKSAAEYLESLGVPRHHIIIGSGGADFPADRSGMVSSHYGKGEPLDRRVEVLCIPNPYVETGEE
jgi:hypothetical protein